MRGAGLSGRVRQLRGIRPKARPTPSSLTPQPGGSRPRRVWRLPGGGSSAPREAGCFCSGLGAEQGTADAPRRWVPRDTRLGKPCLGDCALPTIPAGLLRPHKTRNILPGPHALGKEFPKTMCPNFSTGCSVNGVILVLLLHALPSLLLLSALLCAWKLRLETFPTRFQPSPTGYFGFPIAF